jgi:hypothetical protein
MPITTPISYLTSTNYAEYTDTTGDLNNWVGGEYKGQVLVNEIAGQDLVFGQLCYRTYSGQWGLANASIFNEVSASMLGICVQTSSGGNTTKILTNGYVDSGFFNYADSGTPLFMNTTYGDMTYLAPSQAGNVVRLIGYTFWNVDYQPNGLNIIYFNPDNTWIEL